MFGLLRCLTVLASGVLQFEAASGSFIAAGKIFVQAELQCSAMIIESWQQQKETFESLT